MPDPFEDRFSTFEKEAKRMSDNTTKMGCLFLLAILLVVAMICGTAIIIFK